MLQWDAELHPMGVRMGCYVTPLGCYFQTAGVERMSKNQYYLFVFHILYINYECSVQQQVHSMHV